MANITEIKVKEALEKIRPAIQEDGGDIELVGVEGEKVSVRLHGACVGCPMAKVTLKQGVEAMLKDEVDPSITVEQVTE